MTQRATFIGLVCLGLILTTPGIARDVETVLIVSIDALHPSALSERTSPTLYTLMQPGRFTLEGKSVDPPLTLIAHTAMMTGLVPEKNGKQDNEWNQSRPRVKALTLFDDAKRLGYRTAFYYAKPKLGYLVSNAVDEHGLEPADGIERVRSFFRENGRRMAFLHVSGLEGAGTDSGWLSPDYLEELTDIDRTLRPLLEQLHKRGTYVIVVTSDHSGHERQHGTQHPEDFRLPLIVATNLAGMPNLSGRVWHITELRELLQELLSGQQ